MVEPIPFAVRVERQRDEVIVALEGELDVAGAPDFEATVDEAIQPGPYRVVIDLDRLTFMDSSGIGALVNAHQAALAAGNQLVVRGCSKPIRRVLEITGADAVVTIES